MPKQKLVVITGAGVSAESGIATFRDSGGLWEGYEVMEVASYEGWVRNPELVLHFYNERRRQAGSVKPNAAHEGIAALESDFDVTVITQNVDNLHERAGSTHIIHLHGELNKARSVRNENMIIDIGTDDINLGDRGPDGEQLRPHIVWFGEMVPKLEEAAAITETADILVVVGTSLVVYPAAGLVNYAPYNSSKYIIDPSVPELLSYQGWQHIKEKATTGVTKLLNKLIKNV